MPQKTKRPSPPADPPTASSSSDSEEEQPSSQPQQHQGRHQPPPPPPQQEENETSSEETDEEEDEAQPSYTIKPAVKIHPPQPNPKPDSESGSDSEPDAPAPPPNPKVKPLISKSKAQSSAAGATRSASKRHADNNGNVSESKRAKKKALDGAGPDEENEEDGKKPNADSKNPFQRIFSEEDELAILKGIVEFTSKTGLDYLKQVDAFHDFMKKSLSVDASRHQLKQKIQRCRKKYNNAVRGKNSDPCFSKPHDQKAFELMKKIWGSDNGASEKPLSNGKGKEISARSVGTRKPKSKSEAKSEPMLVTMDSKEYEKVDDEMADTGLPLNSMIRFGKGLGLDEDVVKEGMVLIDASKKAELEVKWKKLQIAELELYMKRAELVAEQSKLIIQGYMSSKN